MQNLRGVPLDHTDRGPLTGHDLRQQFALPEVVLQTDRVRMLGSPPTSVSGRRIAIYIAWAFLFLPAQGLWLVYAIDHGGAWWVLWACVLAALIASVVDVSIRERRRGQDSAWPPLLNSLLIVEVASILGYVLFKLCI